MSILTVHRPVSGVLEAVVASGHPDNRLDAEQVVELDSALGTIGKEHPDVVLVRGADGFCAGRVGYPTDVSVQDLDRIVEQTYRLGRRMEGLASPTVAYVEGTAGGVGANLALRADTVIMHEDAVLTFQEVDHGFAPLIALDLLLRKLPGQLAFNTIALGTRIEAERALSLGLITAVGDVRAARDTATRFARSSSILRTCKDFVAERRLTSEEDREEFVLRRMRQELVERWL